MLHSFVLAVWIACPVVLAGFIHVGVIKLRLFAGLAGVPLDGGLKLGGRTLFGANKTLRGAIVMVVATVECTRLQVWFASSWEEANHLMPAFERAHPIIWGALVGAGYIAGELPNSFIKRRLGVGPGAAAPGRLGFALWLVDQIDSMIGVLIFLSPVWAPPWDVIVALLVITLVVHPTVAWTMVLLGLKSRVG